MIRVVRTNLHELDVDAVVRTVDTRLEALTPLDRTIGLLAGADLLERLQAGGELPIGAAVLTPAGGLRAGFVIHAAIRSSEDAISEHTIERALTNALRQAAAWEIGSLALAPLGTGAGNLDAERSARAVVRVIQEHRAHAEFPTEVIIAVTNGYEEDTFAREVARILPEPPSPPIEEPRP